MRRAVQRAVLVGLGIVTSTGALAGPQRGHDLFTGSAPLVGKIDGHSQALPPASVRCVNCHAPATAAPASASSFGPLLTRAHLTSSIERRGGPPSRYDEAAFCRLLRLGVDPAYVVVQRAMPRYTLPDSDCQALWHFVMGASLP